MHSQVVNRLLRVIKLRSVFDVISGLTDKVENDSNNESAKYCQLQTEEKKS